MAISVSIILIMPISMKGSLEYANPSTPPHSAPLALGVENSAAVPPLLVGQPFWLPVRLESTLRSIESPDKVQTLQRQEELHSPSISDGFNFSQLFSGCGRGNQTLRRLSRRSKSILLWDRPGRSIHAISAMASLRCCQKLKASTHLETFYQ